MKTDEIAGKGNHNTALFWEYDTRIARRWNVDPVKDYSMSPYAVFNGNPVMNSDALGNAPSSFADEKGKVVGGTTTDNDKGVYAVPGLTAQNFKIEDISKYKQQGKKIGETYSLQTFLAPEDNKWRGQIHFNNEAEVNIGIATRRLGRFMQNHTEDESFNEYKNKAGNGGDYDVKSWGIDWSKATQEEKFIHVYQASYYGRAMIMTKRDQGNFFAGRAANMIGLSLEKTMSGFGAFQANGNKTGFMFKLMAGINMADQLFMNFIGGGTQAGSPVIRPVFPDDQVSEDLQRAGYKQFSR